jgi:hypothetical protein
MAGEAAIEFECPSCQKVTRVPAAYGGRKGKCPKCGFVLEVPKPDAEPELAPVRRGSDDAADDGPSTDQKPCRFCGEKISRKASKCRHCGEWLDGRVRAARDGAGVGGGGGVHIVLRVWGVIIAGLAGLNIVGTAVGPAQPGQKPIALFMGVLLLLAGVGCFKGMRLAIGCLAIVCALTVVGGLAIAGGMGAGGMGFVVIGIGLVVYLPPVIVGAISWSKLT